MKKLLSRRVLPLVIGGAAGVLSGGYFSAASATVFTITVGGVDYNVTTVTGSYNNLQTSLENTPWWGNLITGIDVMFAYAAVDATFNYNVLQGSFSGGPINTGLAFAYSVSTGVSAVAAINESLGFYFIPELENALALDQEYVYAVLAPQATPIPFDIPGGATIPTVGGVFALALMRKVKKQMAFTTQVNQPEKVVS